MRYQTGCAGRVFFLKEKQFQLDLKTYRKRGNLPIVTM